MNKNDQTLVILTPGFPENEADSTCLPMQQSFIRCLKEQYPKLNIIILSFQYPYFRKTYSWFGIKVISFDGRNKGGLPRLLLRRRLERVLQDINNTTPLSGLLSFWLGECALVGKRFADKHALKHFCWILGQDAKKDNKYVGRINPKPGELIALSDFLQDEFERNHGTRPLHVIPSAIDPGQFNIDPTERDIDIMAAGSLIPLKQFEMLPEIVAGIKKQMPNVNMILAGAGPEKEKLQSIIANLGLQSNIRMVGELPHAEVVLLMQRSKVFLHPSSYEGFSGVCLEALFAGAHVVSFCKPMRQEIKHWHIVETVDEMKQKALEILQDPHTDHTSIVPFLMTENVRAVGMLFDNFE